MILDKLNKYKFAGGFVSSVGTEIALIGFAFFTGILSARWLGPEGRGEFASIILWPNVIAAVGNLGIRDALVYYQAKREYEQSVLNATALLLAMVQSAVLVGIGLLLIPYLTRNQPAEVGQLSLQFLAFIPLNLLALYMLGLLRGRLNISAYNAIRVSVNATYLGGMIILWVMDAVTLQNLTYVLLIANLVVTCWATGKTLSGGKAISKINITLIGKLFNYGIRNHLGSISNMLNQRMDQMLMAIVLTPAELGWYVVAVSSSGFVNLVSKAVSLFTFPKIAETQGTSANRHLIGLYSRINITGTLLISGILIVTLPIMIPLIYTSAFRPSIIPAEILVIATMFLAIGQNWAAAFQGAGQPMILAKAEGISLLVTLAGLAVLLPWLGIIGASLVSVFAYGISALYLFIRVQKNWELELHNFLYPMTPWHFVKVIRTSFK